MSASALLKHLFLPHNSNNNRAKLLHPSLITVTIVVFLLFQFLIPIVPSFIPVAWGNIATIPPEKIIELTNQERSKAGLNQLRLDPLLTQAALAKAAYMFAKDYWAHTAPDGTEPWKFVTDAGYGYRFAGENLARDFSTPEAVVAAWTASPSHKENLLSPRYKDIGVAVVSGELNGVQTTLVVQFFGTKMSDSLGLEPTNQINSSQLSGNLQPAVAGLSNIQTPNLVISPFNLTKNLGLLLAVLFLAVFALDVILIQRRNIARSSSHSVAHILFISMILVVIFIFRKGVVL